MRITEEEYQVLERIAEERHRIHKNQKSHRKFSDNYELKGIIGEYCFAKKYNLPFDEKLRPSGDGRKDFIVGKFSLDVKTASIPNNLIVEKDKRHAVILILAGISEDLREITFLGWELSAIMKYMPFKDFGYKVINHYLNKKDLRPMDQLEIIIKKEIENLP